MENNLTAEAPEIIVVGIVTDKFGRNAADWLKQHRINFTSTDDIYSATALICQMKNSFKALIIVTIEELSKENMRFLDIAAELGNITCCLLATNIDQISGEITNNTAVLVIDQFDSLAGSSNPESVTGTPFNKNKKISLDRNDYALSEDEMSALLGPR